MAAYCIHFRSVSLAAKTTFTDKALLKVTDTAEKWFSLCNADEYEHWQVSATFDRTKNYTDLPSL